MHSLADRICWRPKWVFLLHTRHCFEVAHATLVKPQCIPACCYFFVKKTLCQPLVCLSCCSVHHLWTSFLFLHVAPFAGVSLCSPIWLLLILLHAWIILVRPSWNSANLLYLYWAFGCHQSYLVVVAKIRMQLPLLCAPLLLLVCCFVGSVRQLLFHGTFDEFIVAASASAHTPTHTHPNTWALVVKQAEKSTYLHGKFGSQTEGSAFWLPFLWLLMMCYWQLPPTACMCLAVCDCHYSYAHIQGNFRHIQLSAKISIWKQVNSIVENPINCFDGWVRGGFHNSRDFQLFPLTQNI